MFLYPLEYNFILICFYQAETILGDPNPQETGPKGDIFSPSCSENEEPCRDHCQGCVWGCGRTGPEELVQRQRREVIGLQGWGLRQALA